jgi:hypothetical protein
VGWEGDEGKNYRPHLILTHLMPPVSVHHVGYVLCRYWPLVQDVQEAQRKFSCRLSSVVSDLKKIFLWATKDSALSRAQVSTHGLQSIYANTYHKLPTTYIFRFLFTKLYFNNQLPSQGKKYYILTSKRW